MLQEKIWVLNKWAIGYWKMGPLEQPDLLIRANKSASFELGDLAGEESWVFLIICLMQFSISNHDNNGQVIS